ncbi:MAG: hypothetical protein JSS10_02230 [Verrucomicrobia bacterium]|nr:hypothetical protein [Verrucomicrobiota bacterium]
MATHLSLTNSLLENLSLVARGNSMTQDYAVIYEEMVQQEFPAKINTLKVTSLVMGGVSLVIARMIHKKAGIVLACATAIPLLGFFYLRQRENVYLPKLENSYNGIRSVFLQMMKYLDEERQFKESILIREFNAQKAKVTGYEADAKAALFLIESGFNTQKIKLADASEKERCATHEKIRNLATAILAMSKPSMIPDQRWEDFQTSCYKFLHGRNNHRYVTPHNPYVPLERKDGSWEARGFQ